MLKPIKFIGFNNLKLIYYMYRYVENIKVLPGHLIGCNKKSEIVRHFQGRLCDEIGLLCDKLCDLFRANLHCFTRIQRRKTTLMLFIFYFVPEKKKDTCLILHDAVTPLTTLLVSEIKMAVAQISDVLQGFL